MMTVKVNLGRATIRDLLDFMNPPEGRNAGENFYTFCDKVVEGGVMEVGMDEMPGVVKTVAEELAAHWQEIAEFISMGMTLGRIDQMLNSDDEDSDD